MKLIIEFLCSLIVSSTLADLIVMNPSELAREFPLEGDQRRIPSKLSNIGYGSIQRGATRIGQLIVPEDGHDMRGCRPFEWDDFDLE